jgi:hypothetical protein
MNFCNCFRLLSAIGLATALAAPAHAQTRVGEAAVVQNEVLRVAGPSITQIKPSLRAQRSNPSFHA